ncbi:his Kinase A domain protein [Rhodoferax antarcticus ANT.BR]|uniref:histidine kinase n=2 Tax=Rhodoferax antarcticus TaxID=81479 RepID=A0A1Q8YCH8_9BURK|nr:his Kinase A domain protein [Rhodoferax antarcticus ANT.BR]
MNSLWPTSFPNASHAELDQPQEFERLWRGFMTARATLGLMLALFQVGIYALIPQQSSAPLLICLTYFAAALAVRLTGQPQQLQRSFDASWLQTVGVDVLAFATLQIVQGGAIDYTPLFALPVLVVGVLGSMLLAMATAASVTLLLFAHAAWLMTRHTGDVTGNFLQAALTGAGCFAISFIASQLATRLANVELRAQRNQLAVAEQRRVNELVIKSLTDGVLVVDEGGKVRSTNPAACLLLDTRAQNDELDLSTRPGWQTLMQLVHASFASHHPQQADITVDRPGSSPRRLRVRTQLTGSLKGQTQEQVQGLCVVFMQDQREIQARIRAEKLAGMGRMSAAVAHEIRNPLAAITQANALLTEDLSDPAQQRLAQMVGQNALRLENIVKDVLHLAHAGEPGRADSAKSLDICKSTERICRDWGNQHAAGGELGLSLPIEPLNGWFDVEHLRRVLINLLDNAQRFASHRPSSIQVSLESGGQMPSKIGLTLRVWSDGTVLDPSVEQHLFEPFFSSESRSSGLGLYICRELCESHGATISYDRSDRLLNQQLVPGNEFRVVFKPAPDQPATP